jgi:hypothetical protein
VRTEEEKALALAQLDMFNIPELDDENYSIKGNSLAESVMGAKIKPVYKRCFEGILTKLKFVNIQDYIVNDRPLRIQLTQDEYRAMFPRDNRITQIFIETARFYTRNTTLEIPSYNKNVPSKLVNVVDTAQVLENGTLEILFTRGILPYLSNEQDKFLALDIREFSKLTSKYAQKLYELLTSWRMSDDSGARYRVPVDLFMRIMSVPASYSQSQFFHQILSPAINEIVEKTSFVPTVFPERGSKGKAIKYYDFSVTVALPTDGAFSDEPAELPVQKEIPIENRFKHFGITDEMIATIVETKRSKDKPVSQFTVDSYLEMIINCAKRPDTHDLNDCLSIAISSGWIVPKCEWLIDAEKAAKIKASQQIKQTALNLEDQKTEASKNALSIEEKKALLQEVKKTIKDQTGD